MNGASRQYWKNFSVLVVDDNRTNRRLMRHFFRTLGLDPLLAENGAEAVDVFRMQPLDLILMDKLMPGMDGVEATRAIRRIELAYPYRGHCHITAVTASVYPGVMEECLEAGMDGFLSKPITMREISSLIETLPVKERGAAGRQFIEANVGPH